MKVLILETNKGVLRLIRQIIEEIVEQTYDCSSGEDPVAAYLRYRPDLTIVDIDGVTVDGLAILQKIKRADDGAKVLAITSYGDPALQEAAIALGAYDCLSKEDLSRLKYKLT